MRSFFTDNVNSILGAISIHLMVVIAFLWFKLGEVDKSQKEQVLIEFNEEIITPEEQEMEKRLSEEGYGEEMPALDRQTLHNIASNVASKIDEEISTERYEQQVMQELGISSLEPGELRWKKRMRRTMKMPLRSSCSMRKRRNMR